MAIFILQLFTGFTFVLHREQITNSDVLNEMRLTYEETFANIGYYYAIILKTGHSKNSYLQHWSNIGVTVHV